MSQSKIDSLLEKYWEGNTTLSEESELKSYFLSAEVGEKHLVYRDLFAFYKAEQEVTHPGKIRSFKKFRQRQLGRVVGLAASVVLLVGLTLVFVVNRPVAQTDSWVKYEVQDPEKAREVAVEAMAFLSSRMQKGENELKMNVKSLNRLPFKK